MYTSSSIVTATTATIAVQSISADTVSTYSVNMVFASVVDDTLLT
jgi:hypothetical protein